MSDQNQEQAPIPFSITPPNVSSDFDDLQAAKNLEILGESAKQKVKSEPPKMEVGKNSDGTIRIETGHPNIPTAISGAIALASEVRQTLAEKRKTGK